mmetsp:Transcript_16739/g.14661  ORF Transcript_16739/g.14661 Transcript_16739/m.14661 type:complete len:246 (+) Transcript_16739:353-1090(+)
MKFFNNLRELVIKDCKFQKIRKFFQNLRSKQLVKVEIENLICDKDDVEFLNDLLNSFNDVNVQFSQNQYRKEYDAQNLFQSCHNHLSTLTISYIKLKLDSEIKDDPKIPVFSCNKSLKYLNLSGCFIEPKGHQVVIMYAMTCPNLKIVSMKNCNITSINIKLIIKEMANYSFLKCLIDYRENKIKSPFILPSTNIFENCTLLLWENPITYQDKFDFEQNPYHIYLPEEGDDLYYDEMIYGKKELY